MVIEDLGDDDDELPGLSNRPILCMYAATKTGQAPLGGL